MSRIVIIGNAGSGKSTLSRKLSSETGAFQLDLDSIAWEADSPGIRRALSESEAELHSRLQPHAHWVAEGCYSSLLSLLIPQIDELIFLNPGISACQTNCRNRPWEPHKYATKAAQDKNLTMLLHWVADYESREDEFSLIAHRKFFQSFSGQKTELRSNEQVELWLGERLAE